MKVIVLKNLKNEIEFIAQVKEMSVDEFIKTESKCFVERKSKELKLEKENEELLARINKLEEKVAEHDRQFKVDHGEIEQ